MRATSSRMMGLEPLSPAPAVPDSFAEFGGGTLDQDLPFRGLAFHRLRGVLPGHGHKGHGAGLLASHCHLIAGCCGGGGGEGWEHGVQKEGLGVLLVAPPSNSWSDKGSTDGN